MRNEFVRGERQFRVLLRVGHHGHERHLAAGAGRRGHGDERRQIGVQDLGALQRGEIDALAGKRGGRALRRVDDAALPEYVYCEISGYKGAGRNGIYVAFDFGQPMTKKNRLITDAGGRAITFNSCIDALNYMVCRGWEFVQAYAAGEDNDFSCMLLRMPTSKMSAAQRQVMLEAAMKTGE